MSMSLIQKRKWIMLPLETELLLIFFSLIFFEVCHICIQFYLHVIWYNVFCITVFRSAVFINVGDYLLNLWSSAELLYLLMKSSSMSLMLVILGCPAGLPPITSPIRQSHFFDQAFSIGLLQPVFVGCLLLVSLLCCSLGLSKSSLHSLEESHFCDI